LSFTQFMYDMVHPLHVITLIQSEGFIYCVGVVGTMATF